MTALEIMERCRAAETDKRAVSNKIQRYRESAERITSAIGGIGARSTSEPDKLAAIMGEIDELERMIGRRGREYAAELAAANKLLDRLPEMECRVLDKFYLRGMSLAAIARDLSYSYGYIRSVKVAGCRCLEEIPESDVRQLLPKWYATQKRQR